MKWRRNRAQDPRTIVHRFRFLSTATVPLPFFNTHISSYFSHLPTTLSSSLIQKSTNQHNKTHKHASNISPPSSPSSSSASSSTSFSLSSLSAYNRPQPKQTLSPIPYLTLLPGTNYTILEPFAINHWCIKSAYNWMLAGPASLTLLSLLYDPALWV